MKKILCLLALILVIGACDKKAEKSAEKTEAKPLTKVKLALNWFPEAEHGGYYAADVEKYYPRSGLRVEILPGGPEAPVLPRVASGQVEFGISNADEVLMARAAGADVVALMAPLQVSPRCILVREGSGIERLEDLKNVTLAMSVRNAFGHYLQKKLPLEGVEIVPYTGSVAQFLADRNYTQQAYNISEPFVVRQQGAGARCLMVSEIGFNPYTSLLVTSGKYLREHENEIAAMVRESVRGWMFYIVRPASANGRIQELNPEMGAEILKFGVETLKPMVLDEVAKQAGVGAMSAERWETMLSQLVELEMIEAGAVNAADAYTTKYLPGTTF